MIPEQRFSSQNNSEEGADFSSFKYLIININYFYSKMIFYTIYYIIIF